MIKRMCGYREDGGIYLIADLPITPVDKVYHLPNIKHFRTPILQNNKLFVWVGEEFYPTVTEFLIEAHFLGISKRIPKTFDFSKLNKDTKLVLIHPKAYIENYEEVFKDTPFANFIPPPAKMHFLIDIAKGKYTVTVDNKEVEIQSFLTKEDLKYVNQIRENLSKTKISYKPGIFLITQLKEIHIINKSDERTIKKLKESGVRAKITTPGYITIEEINK
ncbi:MAG: hypothetical protein QW735_04475 [archaeon]